MQFLRRLQDSEIRGQILQQMKLTTFRDNEFSNMMMAQSATPMVLRLAEGRIRKRTTENT